LIASTAIMLRRVSFAARADSGAFATAQLRGSLPGKTRRDACGVIRDKASRNGDHFVPGRVSMRFNNLGMLAADLRLVIARPSLVMLLACSVATSLLAAPLAMAKDEAATGLEEVVVTAEKREVNLQEAAVSVTALSTNDLEARAIVDPGQLNGLVPGVSIQPSFILLTYIRGLGNYSSQPGVDQSAAYNVDGIYIDKPYGIPTILFDQERIEMLRGPQGTLQGRNAVAGTINLVSGKPVEKFAAKASMAYGNYSAVQTEGMINIPLASGYALRFSGATAEHDGYFDNGYGDQNVAGARVRFLMKPTENLEGIITGEYNRRLEQGQTYSPCPPGSTAAQGCAGVKWDPWAGTPGQGTSETLDMAEPNMLNSENHAFYAEFNYNLGFGTLTWQPNYRKWWYRNHQSLSHFFGYAPAVKDDMHSEELRLGSNPGSKWTWVVGLYYGREVAAEENYFTAASVPFVTINRPGFWPIGHVYFKNDVYELMYRSQSAFAQVSIPVTDRFRIVAGGRYTQDKKTHAGNTGYVYSNAGVPTVASVDVSGLYEKNKFNYKAGVEFDVAPKVLAYANVSTGYKAGGANGVPPNTPFQKTFEPEEVTAYQAGFKSRFWNNRAQLNAEAFYYDYKGYQTSTFAVLTDPNTDAIVLIGGTTNSQTARLYGGELETAFLVTDDDQLGVSLTGLSAIYTKFEVPAAGANFTDKQLQNAPAFTASVNYDHTFRFNGGANVVAHWESRYEAGQWVDYRHTPGSYQAPFSRHSVDVTYNSADDRWSVGAYVRNIFNDDALLVANGGLGPYMLGSPYPPRTLGVRVTAHY
jgi:iron complex outermembrane receptor protein